MKLTFLSLLLFTLTGFAQESQPPKDPGALLLESQKVDWEEAISESVEIDAPVSATWKYASNSLEAVNWSIYFDHITPLPGPIPDGQIGSLRRCYRNKDESGYAWDEVIINTEPEKLRQIVTYNFINFPFRWVHSGEYVFVRQLYESLGPERSKLTFQTTTRPDGGWLFSLLFKISRGETTDIFKKNLENIKAAIEGSPRVHPWKPD